MHRIPLVGLGLLTMAACQPPAAELTEAQRAAIADTVEQRTNELMAAASTGEFDSLATYFDDSDQFLWAYQGNWWRSWAAADSAFRPAFEAVERQEIEIAETHVRVVAADAAYVMLGGTYRQIDTADVTGPDIPFAWGGLWLRRDGTWKVLAGFESDQTMESTFFNP